MNKWSNLWFKVQHFSTSLNQEVQSGWQWKIAGNILQRQPHLTPILTVEPSTCNTFPLSLYVCRECFHKGNFDLFFHGLISNRASRYRSFSISRADPLISSFHRRLIWQGCRHQLTHHQQAWTHGQKTFPLNGLSLFWYISKFARQNSPQSSWKISSLTIVIYAEKTAGAAVD